MDYKGSCHCGEITFEFTSLEITEGVRCDCSLCQRKGATMTPFVVSPEDIRTDWDNENLATYQFGSCIAEHHFCKKCGIYPFHQTFSFPGQYRINIGCVEGVNAINLPTKTFPGSEI